MASYFSFKVNMIAALIILGVSGLLGSGILFKHQRMLTFLAAAGALMEGQWLLLTLLHRVFFTSADVSTFYLAGSVILLAVFAALWKKFSWPYKVTGSGQRDLVVLVIILIVLAAAFIIFRANGFRDYRLVTHGFFNGDTVTFASLVQKSFDTAGLVRANPFAGNGPLEYPTLLHAGVADLFTNLKTEAAWLYFLPFMTYLQIFITVPIFFLVLDLIWAEPTIPGKLWLGIRSRLAAHILEGLLVLFVLALSWDTYIYPQSHFFLTALYLLELALLIQNYNARGKGQLLPKAAAAILGILIFLSNAVTGTVALVSLAVFDLLRASDRGRTPRERGFYLLGIPVLLVIFLLFGSGQAALGKIGFSYTAAGDMLRLTPALVLLLTALILLLKSEPFLTALSTAAAVLAFVIFFFSSRDIVVANASRFLYLALLSGFPLLVIPLIRIFFWLRHELKYTSHSMAELVTGWAVTILGILFLLLPAGMSVASAHDNLMFKDEQQITIAERLTMFWIEQSTPPRSIFIASPNPPWSIPLLTGRALLRTNYWLSPEDELAQQVNAAFSGDKQAQAAAANQADYLLLKGEERKQWEPLPYPKVYDIRSFVIYRLR